MEPDWKSLVRIIQRYSTTFYLSSLLFRSEVRRAVWSLYATCRLGDDAVDESPTPGADLEAWWQGVERAYAGNPEYPWEAALTWTLKRFELPFWVFQDLKAGLLRDLGPVRIQDEEDLLLYSYQVAGTVGLLMAKVAGARGGEKEAIALGQAMQITNILRDVGEDLRRGRVYLPLSLLERYGVNLEKIQNMEVPEGYTDLMRHLSNLARKLYEQGFQGLRHLETGRAAVALAALQYRGILDKLERQAFPNLKERIYLQPLERALLLPRALARVLY
ncbi:MAG: phytoene synthase [Thermus sp.]|uniref:phytoene/squalene synthase family protein n=1 Tax=Thermus sp. TaxID=275 RepID=UPI00332E9CC0